MARGGRLRRLSQKVAWGTRPSEVGNEGNWFLKKEGEGLAEWLK
jgi:hypothetical protein